MDLIVGEKVIYHAGRSSETVEKVEKVTPAGRYRVKGTLFNNDGYERTSEISWNGRYYIEKATDERIKAVEEDQFVRRVLRKLKDISSLSYDQAVQINNILKG